MKRMGLFELFFGNWSKSKDVQPARASTGDDHIDQWRSLRDSRSYESFPEPIRDFADEMIKKNRDTLGLGRSVYLNRSHGELFLGDQLLESVTERDLDDIKALFEWLGFVVADRSRYVSINLYPFQLRIRRIEWHPYIVELLDRGIRIRSEVLEMAENLVATYKTELEENAYITFPDGLEDRNRRKFFIDTIHKMDLYTTKRDGVNYVTAVDPQSVPYWKTIDSNKD